MLFRYFTNLLVSIEITAADLSRRELVLFRSADDQKQAFRMIVEPYYCNAENNYEIKN